jgi:hypothetical protein
VYENALSKCSMQLEFQAILPLVVCLSTSINDPAQEKKKGIGSFIELQLS